ncbi:galactose oxidase [Haloprofundus sp. MHR1]|uniref:galactose oxidase n=1 Tax=Haloprofundus sp. MHR1 TaxID=2572921 RepID=UPI0010BEB41F|nr:galactose oxidase [Haloprofundus sp. MHR1]QCJ46282.1 galactose oxidase [Haloprofundus sp. MHR1]
MGENDDRVGEHDSGMSEGEQSSKGRSRRGLLALLAAGTVGAGLGVAALSERFDGEGDSPPGAGTDERSENTSASESDEPSETTGTDEPSATTATTSGLTETDTPTTDTPTTDTPAQTGDTTGAETSAESDTSSENGAATDTETRSETDTESETSTETGASTTATPAESGTETAATDVPPETDAPEGTETPTTTDTETSTGPASQWRSETPLPLAHSDAGGGVVDGRLLYFGGFDSGVDTNAVAQTFTYEPAEAGEGTWTRVEDLPKAVWGPCGVTVENRVYSFGGVSNPAEGENEPTDDIFVYESGEGWRNLTAESGVRCPYPNWAMGGIYDPESRLVYCVGGGTGDTDAETATNHGTGGTTHWSFDEHRLWTFDPEAEEVVDDSLAQLPEAKRWPTVARVVVDGRTKIHALGGVKSTAGSTDSNFRYDPVDDEWEAATPTPIPGHYATTDNPVIDNQLYLSHGLFRENGESLSVDSFRSFCHRYDPVADEFDTSLPDEGTPRVGCVDAVIDGRLYTVAGHVKRYDQQGYHDCMSVSSSFEP